MGGRNINTTKSGKFMNPTDQARKFVSLINHKIKIISVFFQGKEARKKELKKNKKQRLLVRQSVLKGKNPKGLIGEMEHLDRMEYDPVNPAPYNIKVLQEKRKKIKETWDRVYRLYVSYHTYISQTMNSDQLEEKQIFIFTSACVLKAHDMWNQHSKICQRVEVHYKIFHPYSLDLSRRRNLTDFSLRLSNNRDSGLVSKCKQD
jgi:hypothetical protein